MNVTMKDVVFENPIGSKRKFEVFFVPSRLIRYVQIPPGIDIKKGLENAGKSRYISLGTLFKYLRFAVKHENTAKGGNALPIGGSRKKIMAIREQRRKEDLANALAMKRENDQRKDAQKKSK